MAQDEHDFPGRCAKCGAQRLYSGRYDAAFCPAEDEWQESPCGDRTCRYCPGRPARPSDADDLALALLDDEHHFLVPRWATDEMPPGTALDDGDMNRLP